MSPEDREAMIAYCVEHAGLPESGRGVVADDLDYVTEILGCTVTIDGIRGPGGSPVVWSTKP